MTQFRNGILSWLVILLLIGCQSMPKEPKIPDSSPRIPVNKTIPPEIQAECRPQESIHENPTY